MTKPFIDKITIENFRCFEKQELKLQVPDGINDGSGLNILIGENANGKTTILEAISFISQSTYSSENKLNIGDFRDKDAEIVVKADMDTFNCKLPFPYSGCYFESNGIEFRAKCRDRKSPGKLLSSAFQVSENYMTLYPTYKKADGTDSGKEIPPLHKVFSNNDLEEEINVFLFDKNRTRQIASGTFRTTFDRICEDLNWRFSKKVDITTLETLAENVGGEYFKNVIETAQKGTGVKLAKEVSEFFDNKDYENLRIELLNLLHPFSNAFFALRRDGELKQIKTRELGSGIEMVVTLLLLKSIAGESKGAIVYLIDEPELHLHPKAQDKLVSLLLEQSKDKQIILSTHSPYMFKDCISKGVGLTIFSRDSNNNIVLSDANSAGWRKLPWGPSWGQINYYAFGLASVEFLNELYGYLQESTQHFKQSAIDSFFVGKGLSQDKVWIRLSNGNQEQPEEVTLPTYVRNSIHHPENKLNPKYTQEEMGKAISQLLSLI